MRIEELMHEGFGPEAAANLSFGVGWTLIHAPNEAGKSSLLRAIRAALFDIPPGKTDNAKQPARAATVDTRLRAVDGRCVRVVRTMDAAARRKARAKFISTLHFDDEPAKPDEYEELLGLAPSVAERLLTVAHEDLIEGADRLGRLDDLFEIDSLNRLAAVRDRVTKQLDPLRPKNSKVAKSAINVALREIVNADDELQQAVMKPEHHRGLMERREELERAAEAADRDAAAAEAEAARLAALRKAGPLHKERASVREEIAAASLTDPLPRELAVSVIEEWQTRGQLTAALRERREDRQQAEEDLGHVAKDSPLDNVAEDIRRLAEGRDAVADLREAATESRQTAEAHRRELESMDAVPEIAVAGLAEQIDDWQDAINRAQEQVASAEQERSHAEITLQQLRGGDEDAEADDAGPLIESAAAALESAPELDEVAARRRDVDRRTNELHAAWRALAGRVAWTQWPDETPGQLPTAAFVREVQSAEQSAGTALRDAEAEADRASKSVRDLEAEVAAAAAEGTAVTPQDCTAARAERDAAIDAVDAADLTATLTRVRELTAKADAAADALFANATQVAKVTSLRARLDHARADAAVADNVREKTEHRRTAASEPLAERWRACDARPLGSAETLEWLEEMDDLLEQQSELRAAANDLERDERACEAADKAASDAMTAAGGQASDPRRWVLDEAKRRETAAAVRARDAAQLPAAEKALRLAEDTLQRARSKRETASEVMQAGLVAAGLGGGLSARQAKRAAELAARASTLRSEIKKQTAAAEAAEARVAVYDADARRVLDALATDPATKSLRTVEEAVEAERVRVGERAAWQKQHEVVRKVRAAEESLTQQIAEVEARLPTPADVGCEDLDGIRKLAEESLRVHELRDREAALTGRIAAFCIGPAEAFEEALAESDEETWRWAEAEAVTAREAAIEAAKVARKDANEIGGRLSEVSEKTQSATIAGILEAARTDLREAVDRYAPLQILSSLLQRAGEETRDAGADLLDGVGQILNAATGGRHTAVDRDKADRLIVRGPTGGRSPAELSDGTRDLLYLAVRLEFARRRAATSPLPLLLDDVLVRVSEDRQPEVLSTLAALGRHMQVILLTCQKRTADLASELPEADRPAVLSL